MHQEVQRQKFIENHLLTKIGTLLILLILFLGAFPFVHEGRRWVALVILLLGATLLIRFLVFQREKCFQAKLVFYFDRLLAMLRMGNGFRTAFDKLIDEESGFEKAKLMQIRASVVFSQHKISSASDSKIEEIIRELRVAQANPHESIRRIGNLSKKLKSEREFRRRSGQILNQMRMQSWILAGLYLAVLVFVLFRNSSALQYRWLGLSAVMFLLGLIWTINLGRRIKWKI